MAYFDEKIKQKSTCLEASLLLPEESFLVPNTKRSSFDNFRPFRYKKIMWRKVADSDSH